MRRLAAATPSHATDLGGAVGQVLDRRLRPAHPRPVAVALSGGGDSLALLLAAAAWAKRADRRLLVLSVDHRLRPESAAWTRACGETAARLGLPFRALAWEGDKPASGLPAAARDARHRLLAEAAREADARVILLGHTADDVEEARRMRAAGSTTPEPREWSPSPAWPAGRGLFLLRPLLATPRQDIREWLAARGETWIEDPANDDLRFARPRARQAPAAPLPAPPEPASAAGLARACVERAGSLAIPRAALRCAPPDAARHFVAAACLCAAGTERPPARVRVERLAARLTAEAEVTATLAGARIEADDSEWRFLREPGEVARGAMPPLSLRAGETGVWDGRFEIVADRPLEVRAALGLRARLSRADQKVLAALPARARDGVPVIVDTAGAVRLAPAKPLGLERLLAACGAVDREPA